MIEYATWVGFLDATYTGEYTALSRSRTLNWLKIFWEVIKEHIFFDERIKVFIKNSFQEKIYNIDSNIEFVDNEREIQDDEYNENGDLEKEIFSINENEKNNIKKEKEFDDVILSYEDLDLFEELRKVRSDLARRTGIPIVQRSWGTLNLFLNPAVLRDNPRNSLRSAGRATELCTHKT